MAMTSRETVEVLEQIDAAYPGKLKMSKNTLEVWYRHLKHQDKAEVHRRLDRHIEKSAFPPTIHELKEPNRPEYRKDVAEELRRLPQGAGPTPEQRAQIHSFLGIAGEGS